MSFLSTEEQNQLSLWVKSEVAAKTDMTPETLTSYIMKLVIRNASKETMISALKDFFAENALLEFVDELQRRIETKDFSIKIDNAKKAEKDILSSLYDSIQDEMPSSSKIGVKKEMAPSQQQKKAVNEHVQQQKKTTNENNHQEKKAVNEHTQQQKKIANENNHQEKKAVNEHTQQQKKIANEDDHKEKKTTNESPQKQPKRNDGKYYETFQPTNTKIPTNPNHESSTFDCKKPPKENPKKYIIFIAGIDKTISINRIYKKLKGYGTILTIETLEDVALVEFEELKGAYLALKGNAKKALFDNNYYQLDYAREPSSEELAIVEAEHIKRRKAKEEEKKLMEEFKKSLNDDNVKSIYQNLIDCVTEKKERIVNIDDSDEKEKLNDEIKNIKKRISYIDYKFPNFKNE